MYHSSFSTACKLNGLILTLLGTIHLFGGTLGGPVHNFSQVVLNGGSLTSFNVHNPSETDAINVDVKLYFPDGSHLANQEVELAPGEAETVTFGDENEALTRGWAKLTGDGDFLATEFFQLFIGDILKPRIGVLSSPSSEKARLFGFVNPEFKSGLALHNPSETQSTEVTVQLIDGGGQGATTVTERTFTLDPLQSVAAFLNEAVFFEGLAAYSGAVGVTSTLPVALLTVTQEVATGEVATVAAEVSADQVPGPQGPQGEQGPQGGLVSAFRKRPAGAGARGSSWTKR